MTIVFVRSNDYDITPAIPRALQASEGIFKEVHILCWNRHNRQLPSESNADGIKIKRFMTKTPKPRSFRIFLCTLLYQCWVFWHLIRIRGDVVHACGWDSGFPAGLACLIMRRKFVYDIRDPLALCYKFSPLARRLIYALDWCIMGLASAFVVPTDRYIHYLGWWVRSKREVFVISNTCHDLLEKLPSVSDIVGPTKPGVIRLAYLGYLADRRGCQWLLDFCSESKNGVEVLIAGECRSEELKAKFKSIANVRFLGRLPYAKALALMRETDAVTIFYDPSWPIHQVLDPTKFYETMMVGRPVLVSQGVSISQLVRKEGLGFVLSHGSMEELRHAVDRLRQPEEMAAMRARCRQYYLDNLKLSKELVKYRDFYLRLVKTGQSS
jgi:glycosyltransferase involved in cell wall biosynthesis